MRVFDPIPPRFAKVARRISKCAETVYEHLGPGLLDNAYRSCLAIEMELDGLHFIQDAVLPIVYETVKIEHAMKLDFIVEEAVLVSVLTDERIRPLDEIQMRTQLKFSELRIGLIVNFEVANFKQAVKKISS